MCELHFWSPSSHNRRSSMANEPMMGGFSNQRSLLVIVIDLADLPLHHHRLKSVSTTADTTNLSSSNPSSSSASSSLSSLLSPSSNSDFQSTHDSSNSSNGNDTFLHLDIRSIVNEYESLLRFLIIKILVHFSTHVNRSAEWSVIFLPPPDHPGNHHSARNGVAKIFKPTTRAIDLESINSFTNDLTSYIANCCKEFLKKIDRERHAKRSMNASKSKRSSRCQQISQCLMSLRSDLSWSENVFLMDNHLLNHPNIQNYNQSNLIQEENWRKRNTKQIQMVASEFARHHVFVVSNLPKKLWWAEKFPFSSICG